MAKSPTRCFGCPSITVYRRSGSAKLWIGQGIKISRNIVFGNERGHLPLYYRLFWEHPPSLIRQHLYFKKNRPQLLFVAVYARKNIDTMPKRESGCLLTCQRTLPIVFKFFNRALSSLKKLSNQTNQKCFFANRTWKLLINPTNQKRSIPIEHSVKDNGEMASSKFTCILVSHEHGTNKKSEWSITVELVHAFALW